MRVGTGTMTNSVAGSPVATGISAQPVRTSLPVYKYEWTVPGQPAPWVVQRWRSPRHLSPSGVIRMRDYQERIQASFLEQYGTAPRHEGLVVLDFIFYRTPGEKRKHWKDVHVMAALQRRPDTTNIQKCVEDALSDFLFVDDRQVIDIHSRRGIAVFGAEPRTIVTAHIGDMDIARSIAWSLDDVDG